MKRAVEVAISILVAAAFLPFGMLIAMILRFSGDGAIFYRQPRVGRDLRVFDILKFASMRSDAGSSLTVRNDPRVFPFGRFLRATKLNEIPQVLNVLRGDMGLVGPRPMLSRELSYLPEDKNRAIFSVTPGVTGISSIIFRDEEQILSASPKGVEACYREDIAPIKADLDIWYAQHRSLWLDLKIIALTAWVIVQPTSKAYIRLLGDEWPSFADRLAALHAASR